MNQQQTKQHFLVKSGITNVTDFLELVEINKVGALHQELFEILATEEITILEDVSINGETKIILGEIEKAHEKTYNTGQTAFTTIGGENKNSMQTNRYAERVLGAIHTHLQDENTDIFNNPYTYTNYYKLADLHKEFILFAICRALYPITGEYINVHEMDNEICHYSHYELSCYYKAINLTIQELSNGTKQPHMDEGKILAKLESELLSVHKQYGIEYPTALYDELFDEALNDNHTNKIIKKELKIKYIEIVHNAKNHLHMSTGVRTLKEWLRDQDGREIHKLYVQAQQVTNDIVEIKADRANNQYKSNLKSRLAGL